MKLTSDKIIYVSCNPATFARDLKFLITKGAKIDSIPSDLQLAIKEMKADPFIKKTLGDHVFNKYVEAKEAEWDAYRKQVSQWEIDEYLYKI